MRQPRHSGKRQWAYCERSGALLPISRLVYEPGTGLLVDRRYNDGKWNRVTTPQKDPLKPSDTEFKLRDKVSSYQDEEITVGSLLATSNLGSEVLPITFNGTYIMVSGE